MDASSACRHHQHATILLDDTTYIPPFSCRECVESHRALLAPLLCLVCGKCVCPLHVLQGHSTKQHPLVVIDVVSGKTACLECGGAGELAKQISTVKVLEAFRMRPTSRRGLNNLGNTCYLNAVMQALHHTGVLETPPLPPRTVTPLTRARVADVTNPTSTNHHHDSPLFQAYLNLFAQEQRGVDPTTAFVTLVKSKMPMFASMLQQDSHEFLRIFTDHLQKEQPWVSDPFKGTIVSETTCRHCGKVQSKLDPVLDLSLEFPDSSNRVIRFASALDGGPAIHARALRLADCLKRFFSLEQAISREVCSSCLSVSPTTRKTSISGTGGNTTTVGFSKRLKLHSLPHVLVIHLKRFKWTWDSCEKIQRFVQFPLRDLCLDEFRTTNTTTYDGHTDNNSHGIKYDLISVVCHHGRSFLHGHYSAYCRDKETGVWYHFNDDIVAPVDEEAVTRCEAYLLFYEKR